MMEAALDTHYHGTINLLTANQISTLRDIACVAAALSFLGSSVILATFLVFREVRREIGAHLIFFLNLCDFSMSISWFPWTQSNDVLCIVQATALQYFEVASSLWAFCVALTLIIFFHREDFSPRMSLYHLLCWTFPLPIIGVCFYFKLFGYAGAYWCWVKDPQFRLYVYSPVVFIAAANFVVFIIIIHKSKQSEMFAPLQKKIIAYMFAGIVCLLPALANRLQNYLQPSNQIFMLFVLQAGFQPLQGFVNSLVYGLTDEQYQAQYRKWKLFRQIAPEPQFSINYDEEARQPLTLEFDYENGSYNSFPKIPPPST